MCDEPGRLKFGARAEISKALLAIDAPLPPWRQLRGFLCRSLAWQEMSPERVVNFILMSLRYAPELDYPEFIEQCIAALIPEGELRQSALAHWQILKERIEPQG